MAIHDVTSLLAKWRLGKTESVVPLFEARKSLDTTKTELSLRLLRETPALDAEFVRNNLGHAFCSMINEPALIRIVLKRSQGLGLSTKQVCRNRKRKMEQRAKEQPKQKRKGTPLLAVMDENCTSCAGAPLCEPHCQVEGCINLLYEETPNGGLKSYRVWVEDDKGMSCQMCYSADLSKIHRHKDTGEIFLEYAGRYYDSSKRPLDTDKMPKKFQLELIGTEPEDRLDKKICPWDAIKMYEFDEGAKLSKFFYEPENIRVVDGCYVVDAQE